MANTLRLEYTCTDAEMEQARELVLPWSRFARYKEACWMFILWRGPFWIMLPKRAFESWDDVDRCRHLLQSHLQRSRWFLG